MNSRILLGVVSHLCTAVQSYCIHNPLRISRENLKLRTAVEMLGWILLSAFEFFRHITNALAGKCFSHKCSLSFNDDVF